MVSSVNGWSTRTGRSGDVSREEAVGVRMSASTASTTEAESRAEAAASPFEVLAALLRQLADLLAATSDAQYVQQPVGVIVSSLGGHIRHSLDHFAALCAGAAIGRIDYDHRERGTAVETSRAAAFAAIDACLRSLMSLDPGALHRSVRVAALLTGDGVRLETASTLGRECVFVLSHTIHHNALIAAMCKTLGIPTPERFGYAPSTIAYLAGSTCAPSPSYH